jgi:penicillin amidase
MVAALIVLGIVAILVAALLFLYRRVYLGPLPRVNGTFTVRGLHAPVEIIRDAWGVPHIYAANLEDALFGQGYAHAQDRLWQMELHRRLGHGRLAEVVGVFGVSVDRIVRILGFSRAAQNDLRHQDPETLRLIEAYCRGVNAFLASGSRLPLEFTILGFQPQPWQPVDCLAWAKVLSWGLAVNWDSEIVHAAFITKVGPERAARLRGDYPAENPLVMPDQTYETFLHRIHEQFADAGRWLQGMTLGGLSNNWVVDGTKSVTGRPLLASDPHLGLQMPSIWYENHLVCPELEVTGVSFPGALGVAIGHNRDIAWGMTVAMLDVQDLYIEEFHPDDPTRYRFRDGWEQATTYREEITVRGEAEPRVVEVTVTRHGPIINEMAGSDSNGLRLALRWVGHEPSSLPRALLNLNRARNWEEFCAAFRDWNDPSQNVVYADRQGNIGYFLAGKAPIRARGMGIAPVPGWTGEYEWVGWIPHAEMPHTLNPPQHYLASANNHIVGKEYPYFLTAEALSGYRARRVVDLLNAKEKFSLDDFARMHIDQYCIPARAFCELLTRLASAILDRPELGEWRTPARAALDALGRWDGHLTADSVAGTLYEVTQYYALRRVFEPWLGELTDYFIGVGFHPILAPVVLSYLDRSAVVLHEVLINDERDWFKDADGRPLTREQILALALRDALAFLTHELGQDMTRWQWGRIHQAAFHHPLGIRKPLDRVFNRGPYPYGGDANTVWQASFVPKLPIPPEGGFTATWRQLIDVADWDNCRGVHTTGQSGHPASPHYDDMIPLWLKGEYHPMLWSRDKVEQHAEARLRLEPAG